MSTEGAIEPTEEEKVVEAYRRFWDAVVAVNNPPDPESPRLSSVSTGPMLEKARSNAQRNKEQGTGLRYAAPSKFSIVVENVEVHGTHATVHVCLTDDLVQYRTSDASTLSDDVSRHRVVAEMLLESGAWKVERNDYPTQAGAYEPCQ